MTYAVATLGETPIYIKMGTTDAAGTAFQATFIVDGDSIPFLPVNVSRTNIKAGLGLTLVLTHLSVDDLQVTFRIRFEAVEK